ncbi:riboflavin biosynthesis protein RibF [Advenella sp. S44]|uniref:bifunctional riboflavin kinase/FAD synthetase n=1 Tax=Advenella sp. S44 TaxID=1982755 RepID=UPI000C2A5C1E|nr:bifunctional riboflavin kinase/FAD synthetase [Advenella sp. S44]PJX23065.1 riboflavin biosynthesis protein RibF [Advenella sp. S44]
MKNPLQISRQAFASAAQTGSALTIGNFDGVHLGHQQLLSHVVRTAAAKALVPSVMTFVPHPREYFALREQRPELAPTRISTLRDKVRALSCCGIRHIHIRRFDQAFAQQSPEQFIEDILVRQLAVKWLYVGEDFRFGSKRRGDIALLREAGARFGFEVETLHDVLDTSGVRYSSSELRQALAYADIERAREFLGHAYQISGHVIHGRKLGRTIGFPTLNLRAMPRCALRSGIYVVKVDGLQAGPLPAIASLGVRPTVEEDGQVLLEVHILDKNVSAYGKLITISFLHAVRDEEKFPDLQTLTDAIRHDADVARNYFAVHGL